ncbi:restriction endonuclease subunit S [Shewanella gaetbuli]|uniref:Restriction endonuclease subunit S n=1 Tax=Shewanella gaetbuli TaxID=220752 RepID=A0A9X1ZPG6_9GAMM|nr:restriction endonuclease subunit S [Shewanella gaetbuli]MCL1143700.1 restriction endonuclease subunit S [Shewanella gaetbuli]
MNQVIPEGWALAKLDELISYEGVISDGDWVESKDQDPEGNIRLIQLADIGDGEFLNKSNRFMNVASAQRLNCTFLKENDVLIARMPDPLGRACLFPKIEHEAVTVVDVCLIRLDDRAGIYPKVLMHWINSSVIRNIIALEATGTTRKRITRKKLSHFDFPLPPLAEQKVIADKLDELLAQVESTKARLDAIPAILKSFRQSVLAAAVSGKLTESRSEWRNEQLKNCFECIDGDRGPNYPKKDDYLHSGYSLFLSTKNVRQFGFDFSNTVFISKEKDSILRKGRLERGDIVITTRGTLGYVASYDETVPYDVVRINSGMLILRKKDAQFINDYFKILVASPYFQKLIEDQKTGSAQPQLPAKILKDFVLPIPEYEEQNEIVRRVEELFAFADKVEAQVNAAQTRVNNLTQSILAKAFRGELTADWRAANPELISGENSAQALLERIKAEREALAVKKKPTKKPRVKKVTA